jgi:methyl-accepting chemotaxis protein/CHASE3 domain sensor protein
MKNLKIGVRLGLGIGFVLVLLTIVAGAAYLGLSDGNQNFTDYRSMARQTAAASVMNDRLGSARLNVKDFLLKGSDESVTAVQTAVKALQEEIEKDIVLFAGSAEEKATIEGIAKSADEYGAAFEKAVAHRKERNGFVAQMNEAGTATEKNLSAVMDSAYTDSDVTAAYRAGDALRSLLLARVLANRFLNENLAEHAEGAKKHLAELDSKVSAMLAELQNPDRRKQSEEAIKSAKDYAVAFDGAVQAINARNDIVNNTLNKIGPSLEATLGKIAADKKATQDELGPRASAEMQNSLVTALTISGIAILLGIVIAIVITRGITRPVQGMTNAMGVLAGGDFSAIIPAQDRRDEIGLMAQAVQVFKENMIRARELDEAAKKEQARQLERGKQIEAAVTGFETVITEVVAVVNSAATELQATAQGLAATAEETSRQSTVVAAASEEMTQNIQTVASATEELSASISEISGQVTESTRIVSDAVVQADDTNAKVKSLAEAAQKIGAVVNLINDIASQTNLLALNATIEAARAGEAGKGFAVVASEVKQLATQTARATDEIGTQIRSIQDATDSSATAISVITQTIGRVNEISTAIASAVEEQGAATQEISRNVQQAASGSAEVATNITGVTEASQQTSAGSTQVLGAANELARNGERLKSEVDTFLHKVRSL